MTVTSRRACTDEQYTTDTNHLYIILYTLNYRLPSRRSWCSCGETTALFAGRTLQAAWQAGFSAKARSPEKEVSQQAMQAASCSFASQIATFPTSEEEGGEKGDQNCHYIIGKKKLKQFRSVKTTRKFERNVFLHEDFFKMTARYCKRAESYNYSLFQLTNRNCHYILGEKHTIQICNDNT